MPPIGTRLVGSFTTVVTTDTGAASVVVGGASATSTTGTGGIACGTVAGQLLAPAGIAIDGATASTHGIAFKTAGATPGTTTSALYSPDGTSLWFNGSQLATGSAVSGTTGTLPVFTGTSALGNSIVTQAGAKILVTQSTPTIALVNTASSSKEWDLQASGSSLLIVENGVGTAVTIAAGGVVTFAQRAFAALRAISLRRAGVVFCARIFAPRRPSFAKYSRASLESAIPRTLTHA